MTPEAAETAGAILVSKDQLFERADILTIHLVLSSRTRGLVGAAELERMKPTALLINASRGPIVDEQALISVLKNKQIAGAAIDAFDIEPLPLSPLPDARQRTGNAAYRLRIGWSLQDVLRGYRLEYSEVARHPLGTLPPTLNYEPVTIVASETS